MGWDGMSFLGSLGRAYIVVLGIVCENGGGLSVVRLS